jgi:hypothetical protein
VHWQAFLLALLNLEILLQESYTIFKKDLKEGGWNWFRVVSNGGTVISGADPSDSAIREFDN